mmetsp:Transcript_13748/g.51319  ORF Transcript_13748/g.51319 Transcript_13748/m.51319 type:complete len:116 (-) Transcript_13748:1134-1481(-)
MGQIERAGEVPRTADHRTVVCVPEVRLGQVGKVLYLTSSVIFPTFWTTGPTSVNLPLRKILKDPTILLLKPQMVLASLYEFSCREPWTDSGSAQRIPETKMASALSDDAILPLRL